MNNTRIIEISCLAVWRELSNYIDDAIDPQLKVRIEAHVKDCRHCSALLDGTKNVIRLVADDKTFELPVGFSERLKKKLDSGPLPDCE